MDGSIETRSRGGARRTGAAFRSVTQSVQKFVISDFVGLPAAFIPFVFNTCRRGGRGCQDALELGGSSVFGPESGGQVGYFRGSHEEMVLGERGGCYVLVVWSVSQR
jgi:hypothetical protein